MKEKCPRDPNYFERQLLRSQELPSAVTTSEMRQLPCRHRISAEDPVGNIGCYCMDKKTKWHSRDANGLHKQNLLLAFSSKAWEGKEQVTVWDQQAELFLRRKSSGHNIF